jgi:DNA-binding transcriptional ArsR family regulator
MMAARQQFEEDEGLFESSENELKAVSSENRRKVLRSLKERRKTLTELSRHLGIQPSSTKQHLSILEASGFIKAVDEGRKWKYYELTGKGKKLFSYREQSISMLLVFSTSLFALILALFFFYSMVPQYGLVAGLNEEYDSITTLDKSLYYAETKGRTAAEGILPDPSSAVDIGKLLLTLIVIVAASFSLGYSFFSIRKMSTSPKP